MRCVTHWQIFGTERTIKNSSIKCLSWKFAQICFKCEKEIAVFHYSKPRPGTNKIPIVIKVK